MRPYQCLISHKGHKAAPGWCFAHGWRRVGASIRLAPYKNMPLARARRGEPATGPEPFADGGTAQTPQRRGAGAKGGIPTRTMRPHMRMDAQGYAGRKGGGGVAARRGTPTRLMPTVAGTGPKAGRTDANMDAAPSDRTRRQSLDCRVVRAQSGAPFSHGSTVGPVPATDSGEVVEVGRC